MRHKHIEIGEILADAASPDDLLEMPVAETTFRAAKAAAFLSVLLIVVQVSYIGILRRGEYLARAVGNAQNTRIVPAERGLITDRYDNIIAGNTRSFNTYLSARSLPDDPEKRSAALKRIAVFFNLELLKLETETQTRRKYFDDKIIIQENTKEETLVEIAAADLPGVTTEEVWHRTVSAPAVFSHLLGYVTPVTREGLEANPTLTAVDLFGRTGIEEQYDAVLRGVNGVEVFFRNAAGATEESKKIKMPQSGEVVRLNIDKEFQEFLYQRTAEELRRLGRKNGTVIAMNPYSGAILALLNVPGYESDNIGRYMENEDSILFNRAVAGRYNPASTIKPLVAVAAIAEGVIIPSDSIYSAGYVEVPNPYNPKNPAIYRDWKAHGWVNLVSAIARSSNVYFYSVGGGLGNQPGLGIGRLKKWWQKFNLDKLTGIDLPGEQVGLLPDPAWKEQRRGKSWVLGDTLNVSIGQGDLSVTPIQLLTYINAIANGGKFFQPQIALQLGSSSIASVMVRDISKDVEPYRAYVEEGMLDAVRKSYGTAYVLHDIPLVIAGKTGSAQIAGHKTNAFFVGYTISGRPADRKQAISLLILIENSSEGSLNTVPIARDAFLWYYENRIKNSRILTEGFSVVSKAQN